MAGGAAIDAGDGFGEGCRWLEEFEAFWWADEDDFRDAGGFEECEEGVKEDGFAVEGGCQFVEAHALAGACGDDDGRGFHGR